MSNTDHSQSSSPPPDTATANIMINANTSSPKATKKSSSKQVKLPHNWSPSKYDIICGRGSIAQQHEGNQRLKGLVQSMLPEYNSSKCKFQKSKLVSNIVETVQQASPDGLGGFVKFVDDGWVRVTDRHCREKVGQLFRDALHTKYKSSTKAKSKVRRETATSNLKSTGDDNSYRSSTGGSVGGGDGRDSPASASSVVSHNEASIALHQLLQQPAPITRPVPIPSSITCLQRPLPQMAQQTQAQAAAVAAAMSRAPSPVTSQKLKLSQAGNSSSSSSSNSASTGTISFLALNDLPNYDPTPLGEESMNNLFDDLDFHFLTNDPNTFLSKISDDNIDQVCDYIYDQL